MATSDRPHDTGPRTPTSAALRDPGYNRHRPHKRTPWVAKIYHELPRDVNSQQRWKRTTDEKTPIARDTMTGAATVPFVRCPLSVVRCPLSAVADGDGLLASSAQQRITDHGRKDTTMATGSVARAARVALRGRLGRPGSPTASSSSGSPASPRRGRLRRAGGAPWPDGAGRLPAVPGRPPPRRGRLPGRLPRPGPEGPVAPRPRAAGQLALRRGPAHGAHAPGSGWPAGAGPRRPAPMVSPAGAIEPSVPPAERGGRWPASRPRPCTSRSSACRAPSACRWCSATSRG